MFPLGFYLLFAKAIGSGILPSRNLHTWADPETETPNFHIASSFGILALEQTKSNFTDT